MERAIKVKSQITEKKICRSLSGCEADGFILFLTYQTRFQRRKI